ncbi:hypothetical protein WICPIJ_001894 [Wickerhamomyces pijperi]|uniref:Uncharacterized protein n=1 Tax=Wickerhamomyces pijperi TaxID=599730 RepID=A0A9P8QA37_WICPI|nr:hypothetical protein WICPIJ_001894 [Wickerhamomyces pijperi]
MSKIGKLIPLALAFNEPWLEGRLMLISLMVRAWIKVPVTVSQKTSELSSCKETMFNEFGWYWHLMNFGYLALPLLKPSPPGESAGTS